MQRHKIFQTVNLSVLVLGLLASACHRRSSIQPAPTIASGVVGEVEPNDSAFNANYLGELYQGGSVRVFGRMSALDEYDGFAFIAGEPMTVRFALTADDPFADLDVCVYDPYLDEFVLCFEAPGDFESGSFDVLDAGTEFHVVVAPFSGVSNYELEIVAGCCGIAPLSLSPSDGNVTGSAIVSPQAGASERGTERLRGYTKGQPAEAASEADETQEVELHRRGRGVLIEIDEAGAFGASEVELIEAVPPASGEED